MKYFLHDSTSLNQDLIVKLFSKYNFEGYGIYFAILERIAFMESPINKELAIFQLRLTKKQIRILDFCIEIGLLLEQNLEIFEESLLENSKKYVISKEKTRERVKIFRENTQKNNPLNQQLSQNVTRYSDVTSATCNDDVTIANISKVKESKLNKNKEKSFLDLSIFNELEVVEIEKWITYRNEIKKPLTQSTINQFKTEIQKFGLNELRNQIENSIKNGWQGLIKNSQPEKKDKFRVTNQINTDPDRLKFR